MGDYPASFGGPGRIIKVLVNKRLEVRGREGAMLLAWKEEATSPGI